MLACKAKADYIEIVIATASTKYAIFGFLGIINTNTFLFTTYQKITNC